MRMAHYHLALGVLLPLVLLATAVTGIWHDGTSQVHLSLGLFTSIYCVMVDTLLILFMIVTGRVLKAAMQSRPLAPEFLQELNDFFANKAAYPVAVFAAFSATAAAVLGYGKFIGVPPAVHMLVGLGAIGLNLWALSLGQRTLKANQSLVDRVAAELDRMDAETPPPEAPPEDWAFSSGTRYLIFAGAAWVPYLYWGLVVWRGNFTSVPFGLLLGCAALSALGLARYWGGRQRAA